MGSPVAPSPPSWLCDPFTLSLLSRYNSEENLTGHLLRVTKTACVGSSCPFSIPQLLGILQGLVSILVLQWHGKNLYYRCCCLSVALMWTTPSLVIHMSYSYTVKALLLWSLLSKLLQNRGFLSEVPVEGGFRGEWRCKLVLRDWIENMAALYCWCNSIVWSSAFTGMSMCFSVFFYCDVFILLFMSETRMCILSPPT